jgi:hypothetical protein
MAKPELIGSMEAIISGISFLIRGLRCDHRKEKKTYRISVVSRAYCWSSLVRTSLTSVGVPENALRTRLKYLILPSVTGTLKSPKYVDAYRQKSFRHTPSLGVSTSHGQLIGLSQVRGLAVMAHAWF